MTPSSSTTKNVRDIISAVENMYESVNSSTTKSHEIEQVLSLKQEYTQNGFESNGDKKDISQVSPRLSEIVLNTMAIQGKNKQKCDDLQVPEPPRRSKPRNNKTNAKYSARNSNSSLNLTSNKLNLENDNDLTHDNKIIRTDNPTTYDSESKCNNNTVITTSGRPTAMDLAVASNGGKRSMWGELREVVESGVLGM